MTNIITSWSDLNNIKYHYIVKSIVFYFTNIKLFGANKISLLACNSSIWKIFLIVSIYNIVYSISASTPRCVDIFDSTML